MNKTYLPKKNELKRQIYLLDAKDKVLGRLAVKAAVILRGKHKPTFTPHLDTGDVVVVVNAAKIRVTGTKMKNKIYRRYSGYPGGLREVPLEVLMQKSPALVIRLAVKRMLPGSPLGRDMIKKLKVYNDEKHPYNPKNLIILEK